MATLSLLWLTACSTQPREPAPAPEPEPRVAEPEPAAPPPVPQRVTVAMVGDIMLGTDYPENILPDDDGVGFLQGVTATLSAADVALGNLEGVLMDGGEAVKQCRSTTSCYVFRSPTRYAAYLRDAGFDALSLANNHSHDFGKPGIHSTMQALDAVGILHSGLDGDVATWVANGLRMALIAFAPNVGAHQLNELPRARALVADLASRHDIVIVSFHGGAEGEGVSRLPFGREFYFGEDRGDVVEFARAMVDSGADLVFGHGPHVLRPIELHRERLIAYSLGNFATYYGISVEGIRGLAGIALATVDEEGRFIEGRLESTVQIRPGGPQPDSSQQALTLLRSITAEAFTPGDLIIE